MKVSAQQRVVEQMAAFATDPLGHAQFSYDWGAGELAGISGPRRWQTGVLRQIGDHLSNPATRHQPCRIAVASGHGIGKSALIGMISKWALDTCVGTRVLITAMTEQQLITKTSPEVAKWHRLANFTRDWFKPATMKISSAQKGHEDSWRLDFVTWSETNTEAFAGLHAFGRRIVIIFDEASRIHDKVWDVASGALSDENTEIIFLAFGNPTRNTGRFRECFGKFRNLWLTQHIDSRDVEGTNKTELDAQIATYGEESDFAKVRVRGLFPSASSMQLIGSDLVQAARGRFMDEVGRLPDEPVIFGVDTARFGSDSSVLAIRQGRDATSRPWKSWNGANSMELAGDIAAEAARWNPDAIMIDGGGPSGGGCIDRLRQLLGFDTPIFEINFGGKGREARFQGEQRTKVANKRAEMYCNMRAWLERGAIPDNQRLADDLVATEYGYDANSAIQLEKKEHMKARGLASPDWADALALTFAEHVERRLGPAFLDPTAWGRPPPEKDIYSELYGNSPSLYAELE